MAYGIIQSAHPALAFIYLFNFATIKLFLSGHVCTNMGMQIFHHEPLYDGCEVDVDGNETIVTMSYVLRSGMTMMIIIINRSTFGCDANQKSVDEICCLQQQQKRQADGFFVFECEWKSTEWRRRIKLLKVCNCKVW